MLVVLVHNGKFWLGFLFFLIAEKVTQIAEKRRKCIHFYIGFSFVTQITEFLIFFRCKKVYKDIFLHGKSIKKVFLYTFLHGKSIKKIFLFTFLHRKSIKKVSLYALLHGKSIKKVYIFHSIISLLYSSLRSLRVIY